MKKLWLFISAMLIVSGIPALSKADTIRAAGELFIYLDATNITGVAQGEAIANWPNHGSLDDFVPAYPGQGATFATNVVGASALLFGGTANSIMTQAGHTNNATAGGVPATLLGTNTWSTEIWVHNPARKL